MTMSKIKEYYASGVWSEEKLQKLLDSGILTQAQYNEIVNANS